MGDKKFKKIFATAQYVYNATDPTEKKITDAIISKHKFVNFFKRYFAIETFFPTSNFIRTIFNQIFLLTTPHFFHGNHASCLNHFASARFSRNHSEEIFRATTPNPKPDVDGLLPQQPQHLIFIASRSCHFFHCFFFSPMEVGGGCLTC